MAVRSSAFGKSIKDECEALWETSELTSWIQKKFPAVPSEAFQAFEENTMTGIDFVDMDDRDMKELFPRFSVRKIVKGVQDYVNGFGCNPPPVPESRLTKSLRANITCMPSTSQSDCESEAGSVSTVASTLSLLSSSADENFDGSQSESFSPTRQSTPVSSKAFTKRIPAEQRPKELPVGFVLPSKFGKTTDANLKNGNLSDVDRCKVIKTVATCVWVHTDSPSPGCCEWVAKQLISKYPVLADADPRSMLAKEDTVSQADFKSWYSLKKGMMKKFENWRYRENKRSPDFEEKKERKKKKTEVNDLDSDPAEVQRNIKRLQEEQRKSKNQDATVIQQLLSVTFDARLNELLELSDGKTRVSKALREWPIIGNEIHFKEEVSRVLAKQRVSVKEFSTMVDNWKKVIPNVVYMLGETGPEDEDSSSINFLSDEGKIRILCKFVAEDKAREAVSNDVTLEEELVEVLPDEWGLENDDLPLVPPLEKHFTENAWLLVQDGLKALKQKSIAGDEIKALLSLTKLFPGVKKCKVAQSDFVVVVAENCKSVTEILKKPPSSSPYLVINKRGGNSWQTFLACGPNSILEATTISNGVGCLLGAYYLFNFDYPPEAKGAFLFLQEYLLRDFVSHRPTKYAAALGKYQTAAMVNAGRQ